MSFMAAVPVGMAIGQAMVSGKNDNNSNTGTYSGDTAANMALDYYNNTQGIRHETGDDLYGFLTGGKDPTDSRVFQSGRKTIEDQYGVAKDNIISSMPAGGQLTDKLADVEMGRADSIGQLSGKVSQDMWDKAYGVSTGAPQTSISGLSGIAGTEAMLNAQNSAQKSRSMSDMGYALGSMDTGSSGSK